MTCFKWYYQQSIIDNTTVATMRFPHGSVLLFIATNSVKSLTSLIVTRRVPRLSGATVLALRAISNSSTANEISSMRASAIKKELESYGISTKTFLEKEELVAALVKARADGLEPLSVASSTENPTSSGQEPTSKASASSASEIIDERPREERLIEEMEKLASMKASEMKRELETRGVSTKSFFEKSEFLKALAEARVDNMMATKDSATDTQGYTEYANPEVLTDDSAGPRPKKQAEQSSTKSPFSGAQGGGSPFGGSSSSPFGGSGGNPFGIGGMGGMADMLKNMGGMGSPSGGGMGGMGNPFGGAGKGGMGDVMGTAQKMMQNPKVQEIMRKAQANPRIMAKVKECMSNPASLAKYENDPEVAELINELEKYL